MFSDWKFYMPMFFILVFVICCLFIAYREDQDKNKDVVKVRHGIISKIEFEGHSYVVWQQNVSDCIFHDPDCTCNEEKK
jgi:hypothetical protein